MTSWFSQSQLPARLNSAKSVMQGGAKSPLPTQTPVADAAEAEAEASEVEVEAAAEAVAVAEDAAGEVAAEAVAEAEGGGKSEKITQLTLPTIRSLLARITHKSNAISAKSGGTSLRIALSRIGKLGDL